MLLRKLLIERFVLAPNLKIVVNKAFKFLLQLYGRFSKNPKAKTERALTGIHHRCRFALSSLIKDPDAL